MIAGMEKQAMKPKMWREFRCGKTGCVFLRYMDVSENSVPLNPMVLLIIIPIINGYFIGNIPYFQTNPYT
jgi:hypothetical protein